MYMMEDHLGVISPSHWGTKEFPLPPSAPASTVILRGWWNALLSKKPTAELCTLKYWKLLLLVNGLAIRHWVQFCPLEANREHITLYFTRKTFRYLKTDLMIHCSFLISESVPLGHLSFYHKRAVHLYLPSNFPEHILRKVQNQTKISTGQNGETRLHLHLEPWNCRSPSSSSVFTWLFLTRTWILSSHTRSGEVWGLHIQLVQLIF